MSWAPIVRMPVMTSSIGLEPGQILDRAWEEAVLALPESDRVRLLVRADALRDDDDAGADAAYACYRLLRDELSDESRVAWLLRHQRGADPLLEDLARASAATTPGSDVWFYGHLRVAQFERVEGRLADACGRLTELVRLVADDEPHRPGRAGAALALILFQQGRALESRFVSLRAVEHLEQTTDAVALGRALQTLANVHVDFREREHYEACRARIDEIVRPLSPSEQQYLAGQDRILRMSATSELGQFDEAIELVLEIEHALPRHAATLRCQRAYLLVRLGRAEEARALYEQVVAAGDAPPVLNLRLPTTRVLCAIALDPTDKARQELTAYLAKVAASRDEAAGSRLELLRGVIEILHEHDELESGRKAAYDLAAEATLERIAEIDAFSREAAPGLKLSPEERANLGTLQDTFVRDHAELRQAIVEQIENDRLRGVRVPGDWYDGTFLTLCAWCKRVAQPNGAWSPFGGMLPADGELRLSHGLCADCRGDLARS